MEKIIKSIIEKDQILVSEFKKKSYFERDIKIDNFKIVGFVGLRGVGKTTFLLNERIKNENSLYITLDDLELKNINIFELIKEINKACQIKIFYLDELQFIENWQNILKNIYDFLDIKVVFSGSSMIDLVNQSVDLSRRVIINKIDIFSFYEFEKFFKRNFEKISLDELLNNSFEISRKFSDKISLINFKKYLEFGQFGYFFEFLDENVFKKLLQNSIKKSIYEDLVKFIDINSSNISKIETLLSFIASSASSEITINSLSNKIGLNNLTVAGYLENLEKLGWLISVNKFGKVSESIRKEKKFYLITTNLAYIFSSSLIDISQFNGNIRENFVVSNLARIREKYGFEIFFKSRTDIVLLFKDGKIIELEIGGKNKSRSDVLVVKDDILIGDKNNIPLYLFGLL